MTRRHRIEPASLREAIERRSGSWSRFEELLVARWLRTLPLERLAHLTPGALDALLDFREPGTVTTELDVAELAWIGSLGGGTATLVDEGDPRIFSLLDAMVRASLQREEVVVAIRDPLGECIPSYSFWTPDVVDRRAPPRALLCPEDSARQALRIALKGAGIPERVVPVQTGGVDLEVFWQGRWRRFAELLGAMQSPNG